jgi:hypothetical protein
MDRVLLVDQSHVIILIPATTVYVEISSIKIKAYWNNVRMQLAFDTHSVSFSENIDVL